MRYPSSWNAKGIIAVIVLAAASAGAANQQESPATRAPAQIPKTWTEAEVRSQHLPPADARVKTVPLSEQGYYALPVRVLYQSYPIYRPDREPPGYGDWLAQQEPQVIRFEVSRFRGEQDWIDYGLEVFRLPTGSDTEAFSALIAPEQLRDPRWYEQVPIRSVAGTGIMPYARYVIREKGKVDPSAAPSAVKERFSDEQLYALARFVYSLKPPANPHLPRTAEQRTRVAQGKAVFERLHCGLCHRPPLYTNNQLTPVDGFAVPRAHLSTYDITEVSLGTDPMLSLQTRRGTGYYKVPALRGVWYRGPFEHNGSVATLEGLVRSAPSKR